MTHARSRLEAAPSAMVVLTVELSAGNAVANKFCSCSAVEGSSRKMMAWCVTRAVRDQGRVGERGAGRNTAIERWQLELPRRRPQLHTVAKPQGSSIRIACCSYS